MGYRGRHWIPHQLTIGITYGAVKNTVDCWLCPRSTNSESWGVNTSIFENASQAKRRHSPRRETPFFQPHPCLTGFAPVPPIPAACPLGTDSPRGAHWAKGTWETVPSCTDCQHRIHHTDGFVGQLGNRLMAMPSALFSPHFYNVGKKQHFSMY